MLQHLIKLIWNRKATNLLIMIEVAVTFIVLFALFAAGRYCYQMYQQPLGYQWQNNWTVYVGLDKNMSDSNAVAQLKRIVTTLENQPNISNVALSNQPILRKSEWSSSAYFNDQEIQFNSLNLSSHMPQQWGAKLVAGHWFDGHNSDTGYQPIMINQHLADLLAQTQTGPFDAISAIIPFGDNSERAPRKVIGVIEDFRQRGNFAPTVPLIIYPINLDSVERLPRFIHIRYNQTPDLQQQVALQRLLQNIGANWTFKQYSWSAMRQSLINDVLAPLIIAATVIGFLLVMVAMGLLGVLWQNVAQRTAEIGLRRAIGASTNAIQWQVIGELVTMAALSMGFASILLIQLPLLSLIEQLSWSNFWFSLATAAATIITTVIICAYYPSRLAVKMSPAMALHYE